MSMSMSMVVVDGDGRRGRPAGRYACVLLACRRPSGFDMNSWYLGGFIFSSLKMT